MFRSTAIKSCQDLHTIETEDGCKILIRGLLNFPRTRDNGFSEKVTAFSLPPSLMISVQQPEFSKVICY